MDFTLTDEQELIVTGVRGLMESENWDAYFEECDARHEYPERWVKALADLGIDSLMLDEEHGGFGEGLTTLLAVWEELGRLGGPTYVLYQLPGFDQIIENGTPEQVEKIMALRGTGKQMWNAAITEPSAGSDVGSLKTTYTRRDGKIYLNGHKTFITSSLGSPYLVIMARDADNYDVFTEFFVDMSLPGIKVEALDKLGLRMDSCADVYLDNVELTEADIFGTEGNGFQRVVRSFDVERFLVAATNYATALCALEDAAKYANQREQFGEKIFRFQLIQEKFCSMWIEVENMRNMLYRTAWLYDTGQMGNGEAAMCKYYCANAAFRVVDQALQVLGGVGIAGGHRVGRFWRDLRVDRISGGSDEMQILTAGRSILKRYR
ncbi:crotonobetainyl-CoA dehydrogenase [Xylanimonas allomyrinae]|uniref:Crotonobetainyl-CoA dehydrogenase n=1 Tax=Xylanimonas allomyrinae TaxID=2509459 RepID=A0A4P6EQ01_9MICO|nr:crotonobetainyl-CoA dehydrogenase [Xylanimonas allomyrinae]QAY64545.1 crotonobetainyl-CoA dehydrogenase [Xylanimonas allomyrinae]